MNRMFPGRLVLGVGLVGAAVLVSPTLYAQGTAPSAHDAPPARNANVYNGRAHQPTAGVQGNEAAAGVATSDQQATQENHELDQIGRQLTDKANKDAATAPPQPRPPNGK